jgi:hypothetical protein
MSLSFLTRPALHSTVAVVLAVICGPFAAAQPNFPPPDPDPIADCPLYPVGNINGYWQYVTSDCQIMPQLGFGSSHQFFPDSQCDDVTHSCLNPVAALDVAPVSEVRALDDVADWIADVTRIRDYLQRIVDASFTGPGRKQRVKKVIGFASDELEYLGDPAVPEDKKRDSYFHFLSAYDEHRMKWSRMRLAPGPGSNVWTSKDTPMVADLKSAADTVYSNDHVPADKVSVTAVKGQLFTVTPTPEIGPLYYQTFVLIVSPASGSPAARILNIGVQVEPTAAEIPTAVSVTLSEGGHYTHRLRGPGSRPFLVSGKTNLIPEAP